ncbi:MAG TPA: hypothetical protein ENI20_02335 [Bacteroides sp.]|nr:hypothetical protein [Bacteroides sp.]
MNDLKRIEELLKKYYRGETNTLEEESLREFFSGKDIPTHLEAEAKLFGYFKREKEDALPGIQDGQFTELGKQLEGMITDTGQEERKGRIRTLEKPVGEALTGSESRKFGGGIKLRPYILSSAAAVILILLGIFIDMQIRQNSTLEVRQDTFEDPYLAYTEAKKVLYMVSETMNTGRRPLKNIEKLDAGINYMHPVFSFGSGIQHLEHLNTIEKTRKLISN